MIKFIETVAELKGGEAAVDSIQARSIVKQIMAFLHKNEEDEDLSEVEFISWYIYSLLLL